MLRMERRVQELTRLATASPLTLSHAARDTSVSDVHLPHATPQPPGQHSAPAAATPRLPAAVQGGSWRVWGRRVGGRPVGKLLDSLAREELARLEEKTLEARPAL